MKQQYPVFVVSMLLFATVALSSFAQQRTVSGTVSDSESRGMPGVNVIVKGTSAGTTTDADGRYSISVAEGANVLVFSFIGFAAQEIELGNRTSVDVTLVEDISQLDEVVVTALGIERNTRALQSSVTQVSGDNFTQARENSTANALAGRIAGVNVSKISTGPAGSSRVVIRGAKTLGSTLNQPLYVIDGVPMDNTNFGQVGTWEGADQGDGLNSINPDDIQSITVLKGAASAALYGSRAANGVILITTKKGTARKGVGIEFNSNFVMETVNKQVDPQTKFGSGIYVGTELANAVATKATKPEDVQTAFDNGWYDNSWGPRLDGSDVYHVDGVKREYKYAGDNWSRFFRTGTAVTNSIALTGGSETQNFRFSFADLRSKSVTPNSGFDRLNATLSGNSKFGKKVTLVTKVMYSHENAKNRPYVSDSPGNATQAIYKIPGDINVDLYKGDPNKPGAIPEGMTTLDGKSPGEEIQASSDLWGENPWWAAYQFRTSDTRDRILTSGQLRYDITDFLYVQGKLGMDYYTKRAERLIPEGTGWQRDGALSELEYRNREVNMEYMIGFDKAFGKINVNAFFGGNRMRSDNEMIRVNGNGFATPFLPAINNTLVRNYEYTFGEYGINSLFGSAEIAYNGYLFLTGTIRNDWFSQLNPGKNSILYPSIGASFVFTDAISSAPSWLSFGKVRASWAQVGNASSVLPYSTNLSYSVGNIHLGHPLGFFTSASLTRTGNLPNPDLVPFTSSELEFGIDVRFFDNRLGLDMSYYSQKTTDDILNAGISQSSGFSTTSVNLGEITNKGIEILLTGTPVRGDLTWDVSLNFAKNNNKVVSLIEGQKELYIEEPRTRTVGVYHIVGQPYGTIKGFIQKTSPDGQLIYTSDGAPVATPEYHIIGNGVPDFTGGLNNSFTYKQFNLSFLIDFKAGGDIYSGTNVRMTGNGSHKQTLQGRDGEAPLTISGVTETLDGDGNVTGYEPISRTLTPGEAQNYWAQLSERAQDHFIYDASFVKLRQLTFGYSVPRQVLNKTPLQTLTFSIVARNLAILYKNVENIDPESTYSSSNAQGLDYFGMPATRSFGFNLRASF